MKMDISKIIHLFHKYFRRLIILTIIVICREFKMKYSVFMTIILYWKSGRMCAYQGVRKLTVTVTSASGMVKVSPSMAAPFTA